MSHAHHHHAAPGRAPVLDIGGDVGAVVVQLGDQRVGAEVEMQPVGDSAGRFHTGVHVRLEGGRPTRTAIFPAARAGRHELLDDDGVPLVTVEVIGGAVGHIDLRGVRT